MPDAALRTVAIAVRVVDNFGDAGVAWRLARQLRAEHGLDVTLWIDRRDVLARFVPLDDRPPCAEGVRVREWSASVSSMPAPPEPWPQLVVEAFGCGLPASWLDAFERSPAPPVWVNLEYLSAETWVEGAHRLPSPHPTRGLTRWFFYPGFTRATGGLLRERGLPLLRDASHRDARTAAWTTLGLPAPPADATTVSLFCYPTAAAEALLATWIADDRPLACLVPQGVAEDAVRGLLGHVPTPRNVLVAGALTLGIAPFVDQTAFDARLRACDAAIVRGEDSFVRAQWAARPFVWHIYPQADDAHHAKLEAFLARYTATLDPVAAAALRAFTLAFTTADVAALPSAWRAFRAALPVLDEHARRWAAELAAQPDLATQLVDFARSKL